MKLRQAPALDGYHWARSGFELLRRQPAAQLGMMLVLMVVMLMLRLLSRDSDWVVALFMPALSAGWVYSSATVQANVPTSLARLVAPLVHPRRTSILQLGVLFLLVYGVEMELANLIDPEFRALAQRPVTGPSDLSSEQAAQLLAVTVSGTLLRGAMLVPTVLVFWHAPVILHRVGGSVARALFASAMASWRNLAAFGVYGLSWFVADLLLSAVLGLLAAALGKPEQLFSLVFVVAIPFSAAFFASLHASVHACIEFDEVTRANAAAAALAALQATAGSAPPPVEVPPVAPPAPANTQTPAAAQTPATPSDAAPQAPAIVAGDATVEPAAAGTDERAASPSPQPPAPAPTPAPLPGAAPSPPSDGA
ncbi:MAG: hypothetical protein RIQ60_3568 [Pseudomonadota bacterium]|jgi:hypothetical protein